MKLYHGSNVKVENINLSMSRPAKDFGRAFYLSAEIEQAKEMAQFKVETFGGDVVVNIFEFDTSVLEDLKVFILIDIQRNGLSLFWQIVIPRRHFMIMM